MAAGASVMASPYGNGKSRRESVRAVHGGVAVIDRRGCSGRRSRAPGFEQRRQKVFDLRKRRLRLVGVRFHQLGLHVRIEARKIAADLASAGLVERLREFEYDVLGF